MTQPIAENLTIRDVSALDYRVRQLARRPGARPGGVAIFEIKVDEDTTVVTARDGAFKFDIPADLDTSALVDVEAWITEPSTSGDVVVSFYNNTQSVEMLSTPVTIDVGELNDKDSGTPFVINLANADVAEGDEIWVNVDNAGTGALGLGVKVAFTPASTASIIVQGAQGPPGGVTSFQGAWQDATGYQAGDVVTHNGVLYIALQDHTSNAANDEPGVGTNWEDFWAPAFDMPMGGAIHITAINATGVLPTGIKGAAYIPFDATITSVVLLTDIAGSVVVDIWKSDFGGYPPTNANSITAAAPPTLTSSIKNQDSTLTGWDTDLAEGDILVFVVESATLVHRITLALKVEKN